MRDEVILVHSSDLRVDDAGAHAAPARGAQGLAGLAAVAASARMAGADPVLLAGDTFDNARVPPSGLRRAAELIGAAVCRAKLPAQAS